MTEIVCALIAGICTVVCAVIGGVSAKYRKKSERRAELRQKESLLSLRMMDATLRLSTENAYALISGDNTENVEAARKDAQAVSAEYQEFMRSITAFEVGK